MEIKSNQKSGIRIEEYLDQKEEVTKRLRKKFSKLHVTEVCAMTDPKWEYNTIEVMIGRGMTSERAADTMKFIKRLVREELLMREKESNLDVLLRLARQMVDLLEEVQAISKPKLCDECGQVHP